MSRLKSLKRNSASVWDLRLLLGGEEPFANICRQTVLRDQRVLSWCMALVMLALALIHLVERFPGEAHMAAIEAVAAMLLLGIGYFATPLRLPEKLAHPVATTVSLITLCSSVLHVQAVHTGSQRFNILLVILGSGMFFLSVPWLLLVNAAAVAGWLFASATLATATSGWHSYFPLAASCVLSFLCCFLRMNALQRNELLRSEIELAMQNLEQHRSELFDFLDSAHDLVQIVLPDGRFQFVNAAWRNTLGYSLQEAKKLHLFDVVHPQDRERIDNLREELLKGKDIGPFESRFVAKSGDEVWVDGRVNLRIVSDVGPVTRGIFRDVTERRLREAETVWRATHDTLTGLPNRSLFMDRCEQALEMAQRYSKILAIVFLDLNGFKEVNDTYGHDAGDAVLQEVADRMRTLLRKSDTVSRIGGDEFTILCPEISDVNAIQTLTARIQSSICGPIAFQGNVLSVSASLGTASFPWDGSSAAALLRTADERMYAAKRVESTLVPLQHRTSRV